MKPTDVIRRPLVTEKTTIARERLAGRRVRGGDRRDEDRRQARRREAVRIEGRSRCARRSRTASSSGRAGSPGQRSDWKKAWVRLKAGEKVPEFLEGA